MIKLNSICIIEDDPIMVFGIKKMLNSVVACDLIQTYENGKLALDAIEDNFRDHAEVPEVIFLDINMPIMDGWQFLEEFLELPIEKKVRINILTSSIDTFDRQNWEKFKDRTHHILTFNSKPIQIIELVEMTKVV